MRALLVAVFVLSGAAGLIYESIWARYLGLFVGHGAYAQLIVLAVFLGGMAAGAALTARWAERIARPLWWYAITEAVVGIIGLGFHEIFQGVTGLAYTAILPGLPAPLALAAKWGIAALLILPQSVLLGATFPLMSAGALRLERVERGAAASPGRLLALLYFANSLGAAAGVLIGGFVLVRVAGLPGTLVAAAITNFLVALLVMLVVRDVAAETTAPIEGDAAPSAPTRLSALAGPGLTRALLAIAGGTAVASFIYEIAWIRMLALVLGSATHAFELMLSAFILGLALGALWIRSRADAFEDPVRALAIIQWTMGVLALATVPLYLASFGWFADFLRALGRTDDAYRLFNVVRYALCLLIMLPATFCAGMTLPLITRSLMATGGGERSIGTVYAVNTLGSIIGAALAGLVLLPLVGVKTTLILGGTLDMALGVWLVWRYRLQFLGGARLLRITALGGAAVVINIALTQRFDPGILTSGVYRYGVAPAPGSRPVEFYRDGRTATVSMRRDPSGSLSLATNGKPDASLTREWLIDPQPDSPRVEMGGDQVTQFFLPLITLAHAARAERAAVIGFGSGVSSHTLLGSPHLKDVVTIEIEPAMVEAAALFRPANQRVYDDPRSTVVIDDAKAYFAATGAQFDIIVSEPSNPWVSGVSALFTDEFYQRVRQYLAPGGVFGQWLHLYEIDDGLVASVLAAVHKNFPSYEVFFTSSVDLLIVASAEDRLPAADWSVIQFEGIQRDLRPFRTISAATLESTRLTSRRALAPLLEDSIPVNSDFYPLLDLAAERARFTRKQADGFVGLGLDRFPLGLVLRGQPVPFGDETEPAVRIRRTELLALGAALRAGVIPADTGPAATATGADALRRARHDKAAIGLQIATKSAPANWELWLADVLAIDDALHNGTAGVADTLWYAQLRSYLTAADAPERAQRMVAFLEAVRAWDWPTVITQGERLIELGAERPLAPVPADLLRDALVVAHLTTGDAAAARRVFDLLAGRTGRPVGDLRTRLLQSWISAAEGESPRPTARPTATPTPAR
jgi:spermidine synthase